MAVHSYPITLLDAATATGTGDEFELGGTVKDFTFHNTGTASTATVNLEGSLDGVNWFLLEQGGASAARHVVDKPTNWLRADLSSIADGNVTTKAVWV